MNIGIYLEQYQSGGVDTHLISLLSSWPAKDDRFVLFTNADNEGLITYGDRYRSLGVDICLFSSRSYTSTLGKVMSWPLGRFMRYFLFPLLPFFFFIQYLQALKLLKSRQIDFLVSDNGAYPGAWGALAAILAAKQSNIKNLLIVHHNATPYQFLRTAFETFVDRSVARATTIVTVSHATKQTILNQRHAIQQDDKLMVIHNGTDLETKVDPCGPLEEFRTQHPTKKIIGIVGRVEAYKGHEDLILALPQIPPALRDQLEIVFIGSSSEAEQNRLNVISKQLGVEKQIHFLGYLPGNAKSLIVNLDLLLVLTRDFEGFGLTLIEAMGVRVPTLSTNVGAIPEFIEHEINGYLIPPQAPAEIARALIDFIQRQAVWKERAIAAQQNIDKFSDQQMARKYHLLVNNICHS